MLLIRFDSHINLVQRESIMPKLTVYGTPASTYVRTVRLLVEEIGIDYELKSVDFLKGENQSANYLAIDPFGKLPTLAVDAELVYETAAITDYLNTVFASHQFSPTDPLLRARMHQITGITDHYLYSVFAMLVGQRLVVPMQGGQPDQEKVNTTLPPIKKALAAIESLIIGNPYLLGSRLSIADFYLIPVFVYLALTPEFEDVTAQTPKLRTWWNLVNQLPNVQKVCA